MIPSRCKMTWGAVVALVATPLFGVSADAADGDVIGAVASYRVTAADRFIDVSTLFHVGYVELLAANPGVNPWIPGAGTLITLPAQHVLPDTPREGIVLNLAELRLYFFPPDGSAVQSYSIGIGQTGWDTPLGETTVTWKRSNPPWTPPASIRAERPELPDVVPPGPDNPLGSHAMYMGWPAYLIHGTNMPAGVGRRVSHGCIRMFPGDIAILYPQVRNGTKVMVVDQPVKVGWHRGELYLEVHPTAKQHDNVEYREPLTPDPLPMLMSRVLAAAGEEIERVDIRLVYQAAKDRTGVPLRITVSVDDGP